MKLFFCNRLLQAVILIIGICILNFLLFHLSPGDPTNSYFGPKTKPENLKTLRGKMGLNQPLYQQFSLWVSRLLRGDLGYSWSKHRPVVEVLGEAMPATLQLTCLALVVNVLFGCLIGVIAGIYSHRWPGRLMEFFSLTVYSVPAFWLALISIFLFSFKLQWLPASQMSSLFSESMSFLDQAWDRVRHLILPVLVLGLSGAAATARYVRAHMQDILKKDYIKLAMAKGLPNRRVYLQHAFKNALIPVVTLLGIYFPFLLGGAFIIEVIFAWPGMGRVTYEAIFAKDFPLIMAVNFVAAVLVITGNLISDVLYRFVDPRMQLN